jgi:hypothetical protein
LFELPNVLLAAAEVPQLPVGGSPGFIEFGYACPELVEADQVLCGHLLVAGPIAVFFRELGEPGLGLGVAVLVT